MNETANVRRPASNPPRRPRASALLLALALTLGAGGAAHADALKDGKDALAQGRLDDAVAAYRAAVQATPNDAGAHLGLGLALERKRAWQAALAEFQKASELDPRLAEPYRGAGAMHLRLDNPAAAETAFRKAVEIDRKFPEAQLGLGDALTRQKKLDEAVTVLQQGVKFGPKTEMFFFTGLGRANEARPESLRAAEVWLLKARQSAEAQNSPASVKGPIYRALGDLYMVRKIPTLAIQNYQSAKSIDEADLDTRMALGDAYYKGALYNDALAEYQAVVDADPDYAEGYLKLGNLYYLASFSDPQRIFKSIEVLQTLLQKQPDNLEGKALLAQAYFRKGGAEGKADANRLLDEIEKTGKFPPEAWRIRGVIQYENAQYENAVSSFGKASKLEPLDQFRLADSYRRLAAASDADSVRKFAMYDSAFAVYARVIAADSTTADARKAQLERARIRYQRKDYPAAIEEFRRLNTLDPKSAEALYYLGLSQRAMGEDETGIESIKKALALEPNHAPWWIQLGSGYVKKKDIANAKDAFQHAAEDTTAGGQQASAIGLQQLGFYSLTEKSYGKAVDQLEESARRDPKQCITWVWLGQARQNAGNKSGAIEAYKKALDCKPGQADAVKGLKSLGAQ
jgi:tetratricopeptide (TPR) repeat protein